MTWLVAGLALLLAGCATVATDEAAAAEGRCDAGQAAELVGREASQALGAEALRRTGATGLRWIRPGDVVTMDYREDRLNIHLDGRGRVARFACG